MYYFFNSLMLDSEIMEGYEFENDKKKLKNLSRLNIIVGSNNSGKSRFIRKIIELKNYHYNPTFIDLSEFNKSLILLKSQIRKIQEKYNITNIGKDENFNKILTMNELSNISSPIDSLIDLKNSLLSLKDNNGPVTSMSSPKSNNFNEIYNDLRMSVVEFEETNKDLLDTDKANIHFTKVYIPTLRGLRPLDDLKTNFYKNRTEQEYSTINDCEIFTGQDLFQKVRSLLLGNLKDRKIISDYQDFLSKVFFDGKEITIIPSEDSDVVSIKIGNEMEQPIHLLGEGIQSVIIITFPLFFYKNKNLLLFIEEPELYLHPGLQRKLIEIFTDDSKEFDKTQIFLTTHSNHFLDITFDFSKVSIYRCQKNENEQSSEEHLPTFTIDNLKNEDGSILENLGVQNSSLYLSNCTLWVEGITDRLYIKKYLDVFLKEKDLQLREDFQYSFIEYSGNNITHWSFLESEDNSENNNIMYERISRKIFLITDYDSEEKKSRHETLKEKLGESYYCLDSKEIENTLSEKVLEKVIREYEKDEEGEIFNKVINIDDYKKEYLGSYIEDLLTRRKREGSYKKDSGTITDKLNFCKKSLKYINDIEDLSDEGKLLCQKLVTFIKRSNK